MTVRRFNTDSPADMEALLALHPPEVRFSYERKSEYGSGHAHRIGLTPLEDSGFDEILAWDQVEGAIKHAEEVKSFPAYYLQDTWCPKGTRYNQDGLGYCWTWGGTGAVMTCRALEDKETVILSPVSMGYLVGWRNQGNYLEDFIQGARNEGICLAVDGNFNDLTRSPSRYPVDAPERRLHRLKTVIDTDPRSGDKAMVCQTLTCLINKCGGYVAFDWWGHALEQMAWLWTPGTYLNVSNVLHNSHDEDDFLILSGSKCIPDEFYGFLSTEPM